MQVYLKISIIPLLLIGLVLIFNNKITYRFKISDLILILPIIMLIFAGNGRLTSNFASNRTNSFKNKTKVINKEVISTPEPIDIDDDNQEEFIPDYEIIDENYNELANYITYPPRTDKLVNKKIKVSGLSLKNVSYLPSKYTMIGKYSISCCAADAEFIGFILNYDKSKVKNNTWYEVEGILRETQDDNGYTIMVIDVVNIKELDDDSEEQYIYPCSNYGNGKCSEVIKYNLEY